MGALIENIRFKSCRCGIGRALRQRQPRPSRTRLTAPTRVRSRPSGDRVGEAWKLGGEAQVFAHAAPVEERVE
ncbi:MAG TPA: hypothetical protein VG963_12380, partial [Polyangiaceae bacterium]|nr:hypothetical protein [Polyangiaceae bacterium]